MNIHLTSYSKGKPIVFFHGWGFDSHIWFPLIPFLEHQYQIILVDLPGFGLTPMMDWDQFKEQLLIRLPHNFSVIGWSLGGLYATRLALEAPERVDILVNVTSSPYFLNDAVWPGIANEVFVTFYTNLSKNINKTLADFIRLQMNKTKVQFNLGSTPSLEGLESGLNILSSWDLREQLKHIKQRTCFMFGQLDPIASVKTMNAMELIYPDFKYTLFNRAAHMPFLSHTELFIKEISGFIT